MKVFLITGLCMVFSASSAWGYAVKEIADGGTVEGTVTLSGAVPDPKAYNLVIFPDPEYCGRISNGNGWRLLRDFLVNEQGRVMNVVVLLEGVKEGKPFSLSVPRVEARDCRFSPFTTIVRSGHGIEVVNMDPVMHDIQAYETSTAMGTRVLFNSPLPFNQRHRRGDLHATHDHRPGTSLVRQFQLSKKTPDVRDAMRVSRVYAKLGHRRGQSILRPDRREWAVFPRRRSARNV